MHLEFTIEEFLENDEAMSQLFNKNETCKQFDHPIQIRDGNLTYIFCYLDSDIDKLAFVMAYICILFIFGVIGNAFAFHFYRRLAQSANMIFFSVLTMTDLLTTLIMSLSEILEWALYPKLSKIPFDIACKISTFAMSFLVLNGLFTLLAIVVDRYKRICRPFTTQISKGKAKRICWTIGVIAFILSSYIFVSTIGKQRGCGEIPDPVVENFLFYFRWVELTLTIVINVVLLTMYIIILVAMANQSKKSADLFANERYTSPTDKTGSASTQKSRHLEKIKKADRRMTRMALAIILVYFLSFMPFVFNNIDSETSRGITRLFFGRSHWVFFPRYYHIFRHFCNYSLFLNSALNPIVYGLFNKDFKTWILKSLKCQ